jgi:hypothetical protein
MPNWHLLVRIILSLSILSLAYNICQKIFLKKIMHDTLVYKER